MLHSDMTVQRVLVRRLEVTLRALVGFLSRMFSVNMAFKSHFRIGLKITFLARKGLSIDVDSSHVPRKTALESRAEITVGAAKGLP